MKNLQLSALKSAERFVLAEIDQREAGGPSEYLSDALETKRIIQRAIVDAELQPDLRSDMLITLKRCLIALNIAPRFDTGLPTGKLADTVFERGLSSYDLAAEVQRLIGRAGK